MNASGGGHVGALVPDAVSTRERVVVATNSPAARRVGGAALLVAFAVLVVVTEHDGGFSDWRAGGRPAWSLALLAAVVLIARGIVRGRPVTAGHALLSVLLLVVALLCQGTSVDVLGDAVLAGAGWVLMWPMTARRQGEASSRAWPLVNATHGDPLAPFVMHSRKSAFFSGDDAAMLAYRTRWGLAVVGGDPVGDQTRFDALVADFEAMCRAHGWHIVVLGAGERRLPLWTSAENRRARLHAIPFGRDVVVDVEHFTMSGRRFRNLRQAVARTHNAGITTEVITEAELDDDTYAELIEVMAASHRGLDGERGFSMILDGPLDGRHPGVMLILARDRSGRLLAFHRYATAGGGDDISLDVPWRRPGAPNGVDERLSVDMIGWAREHGARRLSLAFAAFPEIFDDRDRGPVRGVVHVAIHLGDRLIRLESLYRYLSKYHAVAERRYVLLSLRDLPVALVVLLSLEFLPHRRRLPACRGVPAAGTDPTTHGKGG